MYLYRVLSLVFLSPLHTFVTLTHRDASFSFRVLNFPSNFPFSPALLQGWRIKMGHRVPRTLYISPSPRLHMQPKVTHTLPQIPPRWLVTSLTQPVTCSSGTCHITCQPSPLWLSTFLCLHTLALSCRVPDFAPRTCFAS